ncbi:MAG: aromatic-ring-hydroxylating dioxygenase subunit beta [Burkholderiaceae bacterium]|jgi:anthranilate 1,2-dioxygenase small subunit
MSAPRTDHSALRARLRDFNDDYAACLDAVELERWPDFFVEDCRYRVLSRENHDAGLPLSLIYCDGRNMLKDRVTALRETTVYEPRALRHFVAGVRVVSTDGPRVRAEANFLIVESLSDREPTVNLVGRYLDTLLETDAGLLLQDRWCVVDNYRIRTSLIIPV